MLLNELIKQAHKGDELLGRVCIEDGKYLMILSYESECEDENIIDISDYKKLNQTNVFYKITNSHFIKGRREYDVETPEGEKWHIVHTIAKALEGDFDEFKVNGYSEFIYLEITKELYETVK